MPNIHILDWYTNKYVKVKEVTENEKEKIKAWDKIVYEGEENWRKKLSIGSFLWYSVETDREGYFLRTLDGEEKTFFQEQQKEALSYFPSFKKDFKSTFEWSMPVTARYQIFSRQIYFYFYSEQRYQFGDFVKNFQQKVGAGIFFFQIGARDIHKTQSSVSSDAWHGWKRATSQKPQTSAISDYRRHPYTRARMKGYRKTERPLRQTQTQSRFWSRNIQTRTRKLSNQRAKNTNQKSRSWMNCIRYEYQYRRSHNQNWKQNYCQNKARWSQTKYRREKEDTTTKNQRAQEN